MKHLIILAAVVLICQSATVPQEVTHQVSAPVPSNVLAPAGSLKDSPKPETPAQVTEVAKDQKPVTVADRKVMPTMQNVGKTGMSMPAVVEMKRKTRAAPSTMQPVVNTMKPNVKEMVPTTGTVSKTETKTVLMPTMQPEVKTVMPVVMAMEMKRKTRAIQTTTQPEVKTVMPTVVTVNTMDAGVAQVDHKTVVMATVQPESKTVKPTAQVSQKNPKTVVMSTMLQPETKTVMPVMNDMKRKTRAATSTMPPVVKTVALSQAAAVTAKQPETKTTMTAETTTKRKVRAVPFTDNESQKVYHTRNNNADSMKAIWTPKERHFDKQKHYHRSMRSVTSEVPVTTVAPVTAKQNEVVKTSEPATSKSTIDPCDLLCTKFEFDPICASNGLCLHEFPNQCILDTFNCKHPTSKFAATKDDSCQMSWLTKCEESDMI